MHYILQYYSGSNVGTCTPTATSTALTVAPTLTAPSPLPSPPSDVNSTPPSWTTPARTIYICPPGVRTSVPSGHSCDFNNIMSAFNFQTNHPVDFTKLDVMGGTYLVTNADLETNFGAFCGNINCNSNNPNGHTWVYGHAGGTGAA